VIRLVLLAVVALTLGASSASGATPAGTFLMPTWSPDGTRIAWEAAPSTSGGSYNQQIWTAAPDGSGATLLKGHIDSLLQLDWPTSARLLYDANFELFGLGTDGRTAVVARSAGYSFSRDAAGDRIAWGNAPCGHCHGPVVVLTPSTGAHVSIGGNQVANGDPSLSPDGTRVVFSRSFYDKKSDEYGRNLGLWMSRTDGTHLRLIARGGSCASWSPDGSRIAYLDLKHPSELRTIPTGGSTSTLVVAHGAVCSFPAAYGWSPDGKSIAMADPRTGSLSVVDVDTKRTRTLPTLRHSAGFAWSPDSTQLLVSARPTPTGCLSLWRAGADGSSPLLVAQC
jgi:WD40 repeat protein